MINSAIDDALAPFLDGRIGWTLHFPMYLNTYCLAHHLAERIRDRARIDAQLILDDWWRGSPRFRYRTDIEIFVGVDDSIAKLEARGHKDLRTVEFTQYCQGAVFTRRRTDQHADNPILVTDIEPTAQKLRAEWQENPPAWLSEYGVTRPDELEICSAWSRSIGSLHESRRKIYVFGAPMTQILTVQSGGDTQPYQTRDAGSDAIPTFYIFRCNAPLPENDVSLLCEAIRQYYAAIFSSDAAVKQSGIKLPQNYARLALSSGQANPFPEIYPASASAPLEMDSLADELTDRYFQILRRHDGRDP